MEEEILKPIEKMTNLELISIVTIKKENFNEEYLNKVKDRLVEKGVNLSDVLSIAKFKINKGEFESVKVVEAFEKISLLESPLDVIYFKNYMDEHLAIQKNSKNFVLHHFNPKVGFTSFFLNEESLVKKSIDEFVAVGKWLPEETELIKHWDTFVESSSSAYILRLAKMLDEINISYSIKSDILFRFTLNSAPFSIVLPDENMREANGILDDLEELKNDYHKKLEVAENENNVDKQLEIINELESITPDDFVMFYNKAQLLDEKGDYQNASEALIHSFNIEMESGDVEDIQDIENYLIEVLEKVENKTNILHCLASISAFKGENENSLKYYNQLVELDENDSIAHLNLGHIYYSYHENDEKVKFHFGKYLELNPKSEEKESLETILENL